MLNHFRTKLLNLTYETASEHIPESFTGKTLPYDLSRIYDAIFPQDSSRYFKLFLAHKYLNLIEAAGLTSVVLEFDKRISYSLLDTQFFKINRISTPRISDTQFPLFVAGELSNPISNTYSYEALRIQQISDSNLINIYSIPNGVYYSRTDIVPESASLISVNFLSTTTEQISVAKTGIQFSIGLGDSFGNTEGKNWEVIIEAPYKFDVTEQLTNLEAEQPFKILNNYSIDVSKYEQLYESTNNKIIKLAALIAAYVTVIDSL